MAGTSTKPHEAEDRDQDTTPLQLALHQGHRIAPLQARRKLIQHILPIISDDVGEERQQTHHGRRQVTEGSDGEHDKVFLGDHAGRDIPLFLLLDHVGQETLCRGALVRLRRGLNHGESLPTKCRSFSIWRIKNAFV